MQRGAMQDGRGGAAACGGHFLTEPPLTEALVCERRADGLHTNVPCVVRHHSTAGFEWGYGGSGPADLALNACEALLGELGWQGERMTCFDGTCFAAAWMMHQDFKRRFVAALPYGGGRIECHPSASRKSATATTARTVGTPNGRASATSAKTTCS